MARTQYYTATTVDGFIADGNNSLSWLFEVPADPGADHNAEFASFFANVGAMAMGSTTYQWVLDHEKLLERPERWQTYYGTTPCWVFTHRDLPTVPGANLTFVQGDVAPVHDAMRTAAAGKNVWLVGGGELVGAFADAGRLDEIILSIAPAFLGRGAPLLPRRLTSTRLTLTSVERAGQFAKLHYDVRRSD
jgi:dihydrofolate reductase